MSYSHQVPFDSGERVQIIIVCCRKKMRSLMYVHSLPIHNNYYSDTMQIDDFKTCADQRGISIDADVALWLDKLEDDDRPQLPQFQNFVLLTREQHNELDKFKKIYSEQTKKGFSMLQLTPLLKFWNNHKHPPSPTIVIFHQQYVHLSCTEIM